MSIQPVFEIESLDQPLVEAKLAEVIDFHAIEVWRPIPGYETHYEVSNKGRIKLLPRTTKRGGHEMQVRKEAVITEGNDNGYGHKKITLSSDGVAKSYKVSHLVMLAFVGPAEGPMGCFAGGWTVNHIDENPLNNNLSNLEYMTIEDNRKHSQTKIAEAFRTSKRLTKEEKTQIVALKATGQHRNQDLAVRFGVSTRTISQVSADNRAQR